MKLINEKFAGLKFAFADGVKVVDEKGIIEVEGKHNIDAMLASGFEKAKVPALTKEEKEAEKLAAEEAEKLAAEAEVERLAKEEADKLANPVVEAPPVENPTLTPPPASTKSWQRNNKPA